MIRATRPNAYAGSPLDRASRLRDDEAWVGAALEAPETRWVPVWRSRNLVDEAAARALLVPPATLAASRTDHPWSFLGLHGEAPLFAIDLSAADDPAPLLPPAGAFADLRAVAGLLAPAEAAILAHARGIMHWRQRNRFCANCGHATEPRHAGNTTHCPSCLTPHFPRTDPAVIMLVTRGDWALLGHSQRFPLATMYSTLAGFVEPGETLEEAVAREVLEETGVRVGEVFYHSSQPWPFPASVMLGFYAEALSEEIVIDRTELEDARWFSRDQMRDPEAHGFTIPRSDSIARRLIDDWLDS